MQAQTLPIIAKLKSVYIFWYNCRDAFPKKSRYTLGDKIDRLFLTLLELTHIATYQKPHDKITTLNKSILTLDSLKFFLQISYEVKLLDNKKYIKISEDLQEIGKIFGGWKKGLEVKTSTN